jgi:diguanylate cyclase (GGDEF)-like protein/PAS domain S-box-containing protein
MVNHHDIAQWRAHIFSSLLTIVLVLGTIAAVPSIAVAAWLGMWPVVAMDMVAMTWIFAIRRLKHLPYNLRVLNFLTILFGIGIGLMLTIGPVSVFYLMAPPVLAAILLGTPQAMAALGISCASILALSLTSYVPMEVPGLEREVVLSSLTFTLNFACVGTLIILTSGTLLKGLSRSLSEVHGFADSLEANQSRLRELNDELQLTSTAVSQLNDMVLITRAEESSEGGQPIIFVNDAFLRRTGFARDEILGSTLLKLAGPGTDPAVTARILDAIANNRPINAELVSYTRGAEAFWVEIDVVPFAGDGERASHWVVVGRDITERRNAADAIHRLAFYDVLTGLPNRRLLMERLDVLVAQAHAGRGLSAVLYLDLDNFKNVNDARGHATGDALLGHAAACLRGALREHDTVSRIGGDEFVVLLDRLGLDPAAATRDALALADRIRKALAQPMLLGDQSYQTSTSIGVALPLRPGETANDLLREADTAMYRAKADGRNGVALFETSMLAEAEQKLNLERDLAQALDKGELAMHLQLQVDHDGLPTGAELLMRWRRGDGRMVPPDVFIPAAESSGLIVPLGRWALRQACHAWLRLDRAGHPLPLSINVSPVQFRQPDFVAQVRAILRETGAPPDQLIFEVTEGLLIEDIGQTIARMRELAGIGIRFSIDDFGTGYSNLAYLKKMPLYELKIDKSFMRDTPRDANGTAIVQSILAMAGHLGLRVVAEGIETAEQSTFLAAHGQPHMQGYLFHRPMPLEGLIDALHAQPSAPSLPALAAGRDGR